MPTYGSGLYGAGPYGVGGDFLLVTSPDISGAVAVGSVLTVSDGTWTMPPDSYTYSWNRGGTPIPGAATPTYTITLADVGYLLSVDVTAAKSGYTSKTARATLPFFVPAPPHLRHTVPGPLLSRVTSPAGRWDYLEAHGITSNLTYTWGLPGGALSAQVSLDLPVEADVPALVQGATFEVTRGTAIVFTGKVSEIAKESPWSIKVDGMGGLATGETAMRTGTLDEIVDASISDGLPWTRPATLGPDGNWSTDDEPITTKLDEVLTEGLKPIGKRWTVNNQGVITALADPTGQPTLLVRVSSPSVPVGLNAYATRVRAHYGNTDDAGNPATVTKTNTAAEAKFGRVLIEINLTFPGGNSIQTAWANTLAQAFLDLVSPRLTLIGSFTATTGQITTGTGGPVDLADVKNISGRLARLQFATPLRDAQVGSVLSIDAVIGEVTYNSDDGTLDLAPVDSGPTPAQVMFGARYGGGNWTDK